MKNLLNAIQKAAHETAAYMTFDVRKSARDHGWKPEDAAALRVRYTDGKFSVHAEGDHAEHALTQEFGTEHKRPSAVMRKYGKNPGNAASIFMDRLNKNAGGK